MADQINDSAAGSGLVGPHHVEVRGHEDKSGYSSYITDLHLNLHANQIDELQKWFEHCERVSDFFTLAYYPYHMVRVSGTFGTEAEIDPELMREQWTHICDFLRAREESDGFVSLPGFEWQGTGEDGDHNVYFKTDGDIELPARYQQLVEAYRGQDVIGIPHHLAYSLGNRGKRWATHDETFSPFVETFSHHGSSERDMTSISMNRHIHMGPRVDETSVVAGLKRGYRFGIICSGDNHEVPAMVRYGRAGVWASEYTKDAIWDALVSRRTFGFTGPRIDVYAEAEGHPLGSAFETTSDEVAIDVRATAASKVERVELYRDGDLAEVHVVPWPELGAAGTPGAADALGPDGTVVRFKFRVEFGWGPNVKYFPEATSKLWEGAFEADGRVVSVEPVFSSFENRCEVLDERHVSFTAKSQKAGGGRWMRDSAMRTEGFIFEVEAPIESDVRLTVLGKTFTWPIRTILAGSFLEMFEDEAKRLVEEAGHPKEFYRSDAWYHNAYKVKVYQGFCADQYEIAERFFVRPEATEHSWFVKVVQADGQCAWASPIWVHCG
ncbi:DUF3604 domain-containing protein [uncultured Parolsenella sp.]|uniref:DUF3604 domain-containing protein n=1 Tax=uncultured Parolsenella sp. TaxID=2083008 RepID=UPI0027D9820E|nr:DUF3604 domain-containing protein [uncultured Parolsenella sp.]